MVYTNVVQLAAFPNQILKIDMSGTPNPSVNSLIWVRFASVTDRFGSFRNYIYDEATPLELLGNGNSEYLLFPPVSSLIWEVGDQSDSFLSVYLEGTGDDYINIAPTRIYPTITIVDLYNITITVKVSEFYAFTTESSIEDLEYDVTRRDQEIYLNESPTSTLTALTVSASYPYIKRRVDNKQFYRFYGPLTNVSGSFSSKVNSFLMYVYSNVSGSNVIFKIQPTLEDPTILFSTPHDTTTEYCGTSALSGTIDYNSGDWEIQFNCGTSVLNSYISAEYVTQESASAPTIIHGGTTPNLTLESDLPIYLYNIDYHVSTDAINYNYGFTVGFLPYYELLNNNSSEISISPKMIDTTRQITYNLDDTNSKWRITDPLNSGEVSAVYDGGEYVLGTWITPSSGPILVADIDDIFTYIPLTMEISSTNGIVEDISINVATNSANQDIDFIVTPIDDNPFGFTIEVDSATTIPTNSLIVYNISENYNNSYLVKCGTSEVVTLNAPLVYGDYSCVEMLNVGPGTTNISISSLSLGLSGSYDIESEVDISTYDFKLDIADTSACSLVNVYSMSAYFENPDTITRFIPPQDGIICWTLSSITLPFETISINRNDDTINISECLPSSDNDKLDVSINIVGSSDTAISDTVAIQVLYTDLSGNTLSSNIETLNVETPPSELIYGPFFNILSGVDVLTNSRLTTIYPILTGSQTLTFELETALPFSYNVDDVKWIINSVPYLGVDSVSSTINFTTSNVTAYVEISGVTIAGWGSRTFCINDTITLKPIGAYNINFIAFPKNKFSGAIREVQNLSNYTNSYGNTAYAAGHTETFILSAEGGFDTYIWTAGNTQVISTSNTSEIEIYGSSDIVGTPIPITLSAFGETYGEDFAFTGETDNLTSLTQDIVFYDYFGYSISANSSKTVFDLNTYDKEPFRIDIQFNQLTASPLIYNGGTATIELSSALGSNTFSKIINSGANFHFDNFSKDYNDFFNIQENTFSVMNICISAYIDIRIPTHSDFETQEFSTQTFCIPITAYNGPFLSLSTDSNCVVSNTTVDFTNTTPVFNGFEYINFTFDDGAGNIMTTSTVDEPLTGYYINPGTYTPILSGNLNGDLIVKSFPRLVIVDCGSGCEEYSINIDRTFPDNLSLPNSLEDIMLKPNERLTSLSFNATIDLIQENFEYLTNKSKTYSLDAPTEILKETYSPEIGLGIIDWKYRNKISFSITGDKFIKIQDYSDIDNSSIPYASRITTIKNDNNITEGEIFINPISIDVNVDGNKYAVIDSGSKSVYIFSFLDNESKLLSYWGGSGSKTSKTKFNNPSMVLFGADDSLFIVDPDAYIVKKYNSYFNWVSNIEYIGWTPNNIKPKSAASDIDGNLYVLCSDLNVYKFNADGEFISNFPVEEQGQLFVNKFYGGSLYIINENGVFKYTVNGIKVNKWNTNIFLSQIRGFDQYGSLIYVLTDDFIHTIFDCLSLVKLRDESADEYLWGWDSIKIKNNEFVQDFVYNDSFSKINQNLDLFRKTITSRFITYISPFDRSKIEYSIIDIHEDDFDQDFDITDSIGVNEFVSYEVFNRIISRIYKNMEAILNDIKSKPRNYREECGNDICFTWRKLTTSGVTQPNTCAYNPISWVELPNYDVTDWYGLSCIEALPSEYETIGFTLSTASNRVPYKIVNCKIVDK